MCEMCKEERSYHFSCSECGCLMGYNPSASGPRSCIACSEKEKFGVDCIICNTPMKFIPPLKGVQVCDACRNQNEEHLFLKIIRKIEGNLNELKVLACKSDTLSEGQVEKISHGLQGILTEFSQLNFSKRG